MPCKVIVKDTHSGKKYTGVYCKDFMQLDIQQTKVNCLQLLLYMTID